MLVQQLDGQSRHSVCVDGEFAGFCRQLQRRGDNRSSGHTGIQHQGAPAVPGQCGQGDLAPVMAGNILSLYDLQDKSVPDLNVMADKLGLVDLGWDAALYTESGGGERLLRILPSRFGKGVHLHTLDA